MTHRAPVLERDLQRAVTALAVANGWRVMHIHDSRRQAAGAMIGDREVKGWPDLTLVHPGRGQVLFRELKSGTGRLSVSQRQWLHDLKCCGLDAGVWTPADWPESIATELTGRAVTQPGLSLSGVGAR